MSKIIETTTDGIYTINKYDSGTMEKYITNSKNNQPTEPEYMPTQLDKVEANTDYLVMLLEV